VIPNSAGNQPYDPRYAAVNSTEATPVIASNGTPNTLYLDAGSWSYNSLMRHGKKAAARPPIAAEKNSDASTAVANNWKTRSL
jgi:hypothetical protein